MSIFLTSFHYQVDNPLRQQVCGLVMSAADIFSQELYFWPRSFEGKFEILGQSHSQEHYQPTNQKARGGFVYLITLPLIFVSCFDSKFVNFFCTFRSNIWDQLLNASISGPYKTNSFSFKRMKTRNSWSRFFPLALFLFDDNIWRTTVRRLCTKWLTAAKRIARKLMGGLL